MDARLVLIISLFFSLLSMPFSFAGGQVVLSLDEAVAIALRDNRDILLSQEKLAQAKFKIDEARSGFFPEVTLNSSAIDTRGFYAKDIINYSFNANIKQYLYKGGKTIAALKQNEYKKEALGAAVDKNILDTISRVKRAFYALALAKEFNAVHKQILENAKEHWEALKTRYEKGEASESEVLKAQAAVASEESVYLQVQNQKELAALLLKNILFIEETIAVDIKSDFEYTAREIAVDEAMLKALSLRPEIKQYEAQKQADRMEVEIAKAGNRPSLWGSFDYNSRSTSSLSFSPTKGWQDYNVVGLTMSWPIFDGGLAKSKIEQALSSLRQDTLMQDTLKKDILTHVKEAYLSLKTALGSLPPREKEITLYEDGVRVLEAKYTDGLSSEQELKDSRLALLVSRFNQKQSFYDCLLARAELDNATGVIK